VRPRRPLGQDLEQLDYENDSDEEWEDEGQADDVDDMSEDEVEAPAAGDGPNELEYDFDVRLQSVVLYTSADW